MEMLARLAILAAVSLGSGFMTTPTFARDAAAQSVPSIIGWVEIASSPDRVDQVTVVGHVYATVASAGRYTLIVSRVGKGGTTNTQQAGAFSVAPRENKRLSSTAINIGGSEALKIELKLYSEGKEIFSVVMQPILGKDQRNI
jgi:hypothetical protein